MWWTSQVAILTFIILQKKLTAHVEVGLLKLVAESRDLEKVKRNI